MRIVIGCGRFGRSNPVDLDRLHVIVSGRVQGVGFRYALYREAEARNLTGWVRNLYDGRLEAEFEGAKPSLESMRLWCEEGPRFARVSHVETTWTTGPIQFEDFRIIG